MYLKTIKASGFKSFASRIEIDLEDKITGIVGPNGSGKSNIVDAVRWVLGEQSVKSLRGSDSMTDVIFSGSKTREALNVASVTLVFDNTDHTFPLEYNEVSIKRRVYRDGTNEYFLNGSKCRLKDITDLLLDSGVAKESFNIISQGKIEEILSAKADNRRVIFEEAANVLKYKRRKEEALKKLEHTHDNINRVNDIISELEGQIEPLKKEKEKAETYLDASEELSRVEVSLLAHDIKTYNAEYEKVKLDITEAHNEVIALTTSTSQNEALAEKERKALGDLDKEISSLTGKILDLTAKVEQANSKKQLILERKKYEYNSDLVHQNLVSLKESELGLKNQVASLEFELDNDAEALEKSNKRAQAFEAKIAKIREERQNAEGDLNKAFYNLNVVNNRIAELNTSIENDGAIPLSVRQVLHNPRLQGIKDTIGNILTIPSEYVTAITTALGNAINNIVVENDESAEAAIKFLKDNKYGRVTFFPLNVMKPKFVDANRLKIINDSEGFIDVASNLVQADSIYQNIILNQLGNVLVVDNIKNANILGKKLNYQYKIVSLEGEIVHVGGSLTGGTLQKVRNTQTDKQELVLKQAEAEKLDLKIKNLEAEINKSDALYREVDDKLYLETKEKNEITEKIKMTKGKLAELYHKLNAITSEMASANGILNNDMFALEEAALKEYYKLLNEKNLAEQQLKIFKEKKDSLADAISEKEALVKSTNDNYRTKMEELKNLEVSASRLEVKIDNALKTLSETYNITYELALEKSEPITDAEAMHMRVNKLKKTIKDLGSVNTGAIAEFKRVSERYEFLIGQRNELVAAENVLLDIVKEMDKQMTLDFEETFKLVKENFKEIFKKLFKGGHADLVFTDPKNILETGVEIVASPPGKKLTSISLLSGGEKTLTAISLLFAILKTKGTSFCILDEVEAALDEANVDAFGEYITSLKEKTQFIIITHKKKTMEYADTLYGITMQESGVSKLVSVRLNDIK